MSTFSGIITALSSLQAQLLAMDTAGHNIANVNTPGFRRQEVMLSARSPFPPPGSAEGPMLGLVGTGVEVYGIRRAQDGYLGLHMRTAAGQSGQWRAAHDSLSEIEAIVAPQGGSDLGTIMDRFWDAWQTLSTRPDDLSARTQVRAEGVALSAGFRDLTERLHVQSSNLEVAIVGSVEEVNRLAHQVAGLNRNISVALAEGKQPNDLMDQREALLMRLSELSGANVVSSESSQLIVNLNGRPLVQGDLVFELEAVRGATGNLELHWQNDGATAQVSTGILAGQIQTVQQTIPQYLNQLDDIASTMVAEMNTRHRVGFGLDGTTGVDFFTPGATAGNLSVDNAILGDIRMIASAGADDSPGDGSVALAIAGLREEAVMGGGESLGTAWRSLLGQVAADVQVAEYNSNAAQLLSDQLLTQQQSMAGVSLDEEMAQMIQYQHAYDAAARVLSTIDEMIGTIIDQMATG